MYFEDFRSFLTKVEEIGELERIDGADWDLEIGLIHVINGSGPNPKLFVFDKIKDYPAGFRIATNPVGSMKRSCLVRNISPDLPRKEMLTEWRRRLRDRKLVKPVLVPSSPVQENILEGADVDIGKFPACRYHELDKSKFVGTGSAVLMRDPETGWINVGSYRSQIYDRNHIGLHLANGHHGQVIRDKWFQKGLDCPVVIALGQEPSLYAAAGENVIYGVSELDVAGWFRGQPVKLISGKYGDIPIPASSEVALECRIMNPKHEPMRPEGPFGEAFGYYAEMEGVMSPVVEVQAIWHRDDPIITSAPTFRTVPLDAFREINETAMFLNNLESAGMHDVKAVRTVGPFTVVSIKQMYAGHAKRIADFMMGGIVGLMPPRIVVTVDDDVNLENDREVYWAIVSRIDPQESVHIVRDVWAPAISPRIPPERRSVPLERGYTLSSMIIDACRPYRWMDKFPPVVTTSPELRNKIIKKYDDKLALGTNKS